MNTPSITLNINIEVTILRVFGYIIVCYRSHAYLALTVIEFTTRYMAYTLNRGGIMA